MTPLVKSKPDLELASLGRRIIATLLDTSILVALGVITVAALDLPIKPSALVSFSDYGWLASQTIFLIIFIVYFSTLEWLTGQTIGKKLVGIRVVSKDNHENPSFIAALVRTVLRYVDYIPYLFPLIGVFLILVTKKRQRLGDMAAKTYVVRAPNMAEDS